MATSNDEADYEVGYGKPPAATQFKPGDPAIRGDDRPSPRACKISS